MADVRFRGPPAMAKSLESTRHLESISAHVEQYAGPVANVIHGAESQFLQIDVLHVLPSAKRAFHVLITSGLSDRPMATPRGSEDCRFAELYLCLPAAWPMSKQDLSNERNYWPIRLLQLLGRFPNAFDTWLWLYHTVPNFDPPKPYADDTRLCAAMLGPTISLPSDFARLEIPRLDPIHFFSVVPLHREEVDFKIENGGEPLMAHLFQRGVIADIVDPARKSVIHKKRFGLF